MARPNGPGGRGLRPVPPFRLQEGDGTTGAIAETVMENGVQVLTEAIPGVRSASVGVWVRHGAAHDAPERMGASHLLEHMVFKGTRLRSAREIAMALESLGGSLDAYTSREHTSYQARVLDEHLPEALEVLADLTLAPALREDDLALEREVVLEEIATVEDTPDDLVFEIHAGRMWGEHPYGRSILGTPETVAASSAADLRDLHGARYRGENLVVAAAGNVEHGEVTARVDRLFGSVEPGQRQEPVPVPLPTRPGDERFHRPTSQTHVVFGAEAVPHADPRRYPLVLLSAAFGGGMSSRLFQRVREELGLAYAVYSFQSFYLRSGLLGVYVGTRPEFEDQAVEAIRGEYDRLSREGLSPAELDQIKQQVKGQIMLSLESTGSRLYRLAGFALHGEPYQGLDELLARIDAVTPDEAAQVAAEFFDPGRSLVLRLGPEPPSP